MLYNAFNRTIPIINVTDNIVNPFDNSEVKVARYFYHKEDDNDKKNIHANPENRDNRKTIIRA